MNTSKPKKGYYSAFIDTGSQKVPYIVIAESDYHAARIVREETGYFVTQDQVEGPLACR